MINYQIHIIPKWLINGFPLYFIDDKNKNTTMICNEYEQLTHIEKVTLIGALVHSIQSDSALLEMAQGIIEIAKAKGIFDKVTIMPDYKPPEMDDL